jgi:hypothetical protein
MGKRSDERVHKSTDLSLFNYKHDIDKIETCFNITNCIHSQQ